MNGAPNTIRSKEFSQRCDCAPQSRDEELFKPVARRSVDLVALTKVFNSDRDVCHFFAQILTRLLTPLPHLYFRPGLIEFPRKE